MNLLVACEESQRVCTDKMILVPLTLREANAYVSLNHRHHKPVVGHKFSIGCSYRGELIGCAIVGRPVSRHLDDGWTLEVNRLCTTGARNVCSFLYGAAARITREMGYKRIVTYILESEDGASVKAAGWQYKGVAGKPEWTGSRRPKENIYPAEMKKRYEKTFPGIARAMAEQWG